MKKLLFMACACFFLFAPATQLHLFGVDASNDGNVRVNVVQDKIAVNDQDITRAVTEAIATDTVKVATKDGVVTLSGTVNNVQAKSNVEAKAKAVPGVVNVVNNLEVKS